MKNFKYIFIVILLGLFGCSDFLNKDALDVIPETLVWDDENLVNAYLADVYRRTDFIELRSDTAEHTSYALIASMGGEGRSFGNHHQSYVISTGVLTSAGIPGGSAEKPNQLDYWNYPAIRDINYFLEKMQTSTLQQSLIEQKCNEVRFLRAYMYFQMVIRFGGVPIITKAQPMDAPAEDIFVARDSEKAVYDFIINEMEELSKNLPATYSDNDKGKPTKWAALALQSRAALYAASIAKYGKVQEGGLLGFPAGEVERYAKISYDASKAILGNGINSLYEKHADPVVNFQNLFLDESADNKEVIMAEIFDYGKNRAHAFTLRAMSHDFNGTWASMYYLYDFIERFEFADGKPGNSITRAQLTSKEWSSDELFGSRDARFKASVFYPESPWQGGKTYFHSSTIRGGKTYTSGVAEDGWPYQSAPRNNQRTGFMVKKRCNENMKTEPVINDGTDYIIFRLGEIYLNLAEAAYYRGLNGEALEALNRVRQRAHMPPKTTINEEILQNERLVELSWENQSYWDLRRWRIAKSVLDGVRMKGLNYVYNYDTKKYKITLTNAETVTRTFQDRNYYLPLGVKKVSENPMMVENPEY